MMESKDDTKVRVTNKDLKISITNMGADLIDTLDSIHNAILSTRKELRRINTRLDRIEALKEKEQKKSQSETKTDDELGHYIG
jgi:hypothetical protein